MDCDKVKLMSQEDRDRVLQLEYTEDKKMFISKYNLMCNNKLSWEIPNKMHPKTIVINHHLMLKWDMLKIVLYFNRLWYWKIEYFETHWDKFSACKHDWKSGFIDCPIWDIEFIKHNETGNIVDLRWLRKSTEMDDFVQWAKEFTGG